MQPVRVVVKLPYNRPDDAPPDPPKIEWTPEKADILWKVIEIQRTRAVDSAGADWKGLAAHLVVPLPYLLYRVNARFQEEIRGLKDIQGALSPTSPHHQLPSTSTKISNEKSVVTRKVFESLKRPVSPTSSGDEADSSDEEAIKEEEAERVAEEEEALARRLAQLQRMMTNEKLGLVSGPARQKGANPRDRGRPAPLSTISGGSYRQDALSSASASRSQSVSSASPPHGSVLDPPPDRNRNTAGQTPRNRSSEPSSPPRAIDRNSLGQVYARHRPLVDPASDLSSHGSEASSFSDLSDASISASALEDAFMSNFGSNTNSNFSHFARSRLSNRAHSSIPQ